MEQIVREALQESLQVQEQFVQDNVSPLLLLAEKVAAAFTADRKLMLCGNGGSAADAQHLAAEFVNRFLMERPPLPALALTTDTSVLTSIGNDYRFLDIFSKQIKALGAEGDVLLAFSTSGKSPNLLAAVEAARSMGIYTAAFLGSRGGDLAAVVDLALISASDVPPRVQEAHGLVGHMLCELVDFALFHKHVLAESIGDSDPSEDGGGGTDGRGGKD